MEEERDPKQTQGGTEAPLPLEGLLVVDLTHYIAGPYCTLLLAHLGATVIKVERPGAGDPTRSWGPFPQDEPHPERSGLFILLNQGKRGATLNLKTETGRYLLRKLVARADLLVENFSPRVMPSLGLDYPSLQEINPGLIMASISNFGQNGPYRDRKATELTLLAESGLLYINGHPQREPLRPGVALAQYFGGLYALTAIMASLLAWEEDGQGEHIDISLQEAVAANLEHTLAIYTFLGMVRRRWHSSHPDSYPREDLFGCADGYVAVGPAPWGRESLALLVERPELAEHPLLTDGGAALADVDAVNSLLDPWLRSHTRAEIVARGQELRMPVAPLLEPPELLADPQLVARSFFDQVQQPGVGNLLAPGPPFPIPGPAARLGPAPALGQHNQEVWGQLLGHSYHELEAWRAEGVI